MKLEFKLVNKNVDTPIPSKAHSIDAGFDFSATSYKYDVATGCHVYGTNIAVNIPAGYVGFMFPRSSISKQTMRLTNSVGVIDAGYQGEILFKFKEDSDCWAPRNYKVGDRIGQLIVMPIPEVELEFVTEFSNTSTRGTGGFGSSGN